jgi:hypothetical protein
MELTTLVELDVPLKSPIPVEHLILQHSTPIPTLDQTGVQVNQMHHGEYH